MRVALIQPTDKNMAYNKKILDLVVESGVSYREGRIIEILGSNPTNDELLVAAQIFNHMLEERGIITQQGGSAQFEPSSMWHYADEMPKQEGMYVLELNGRGNILAKYSNNRFNACDGVVTRQLIHHSNITRWMPIPVAKTSTTISHKAEELPQAKSQDAEVREKEPRKQSGGYVKRAVVGVNKDNPNDMIEFESLKQCGEYLGYNDKKASKFVFQLIKRQVPCNGLIFKYKDVI